MTHRVVSRPLRLGGFVLLGVAAIAIIIGTASAVTGGEDDDRTAADLLTPTTSQTSETSSPGSESASETTATTSSTSDAGEESSQPSSSKPSDAQVSTEVAGSAHPAVPDGKYGDAMKSVSVRVYNNSSVTGLASRAADDLRANGWNVVATGNYSDGVVYTTTAYFRTGTNEEAAAQAIGQEFGMRVEPRFEGIADASPGVIVIVTKDYRGGSSGKR